ncbi:hypothetical protein QNI19_18880 [Cytophagaceae bacterium DM2B3-1]|uniref:Lipoprotein n=1 Tax=Xanthocytophaga flava TaxID=3048013 RepID=A0ABT7CMP3_9BACT|nr:hypothetical protein [Xanthocytophaga flavus]MDJ1495011.1 hypothetical protein [Xanthocytophaga flavus]
MKNKTFIINLGFLIFIGCTNYDSDKECSKVIYKKEILGANIWGKQIGFHSKIEDIRVNYPNNFVVDYEDPEGGQLASKSTDVVVIATDDHTFKRERMRRIIKYTFNKNVLQEIELEFYFLELNPFIVNDYIKTNHLEFLWLANQISKCYMFTSSQYIVEFLKEVSALTNGKETITYKIRIKQVP